MKFLKAISRDGGGDTNIEIPYSETENGGSQSITVLGPFSVDFDTVGFINPSDNGVDTLAVPAGSLVLAFIPVVTTEFAGSVGDDYMYVSLLASPSGSGAGLGAWSIGSPSGSAPVSLGASPIAGAGISGGSNTAMSRAYQQTPVLAVVDCHIVCGYYPAGEITAGSLDVYAIVATPS